MLINMMSNIYLLLLSLSWKQERRRRRRKKIHQERDVTNSVYLIVMNHQHDHVEHDNMNESQHLEWTSWKGESEEWLWFIEFHWIHWSNEKKGRNLVNPFFYHEIETKFVS